MQTPNITHNLAAPINGLVWNTDTVAAACGDGTLHLTRAGMETTLAVQVTDSPLLGLISVPEGFATAAENGDIHLTTPQGETRLLASTKYMFLEHLAYFPKKNQILAATGKKIAVIPLTENPVTCDPESRDLIT